MKWHLVYFVQGFIHSLWWLQSPEIITCNSVLVPLAHAINSILVLAPMIILLQARPFICKQNKCIQFRQHHILMNIRIITKKRKYLIIQLACASSSNWSNMYSSRGCGCNNGIDVLINMHGRRFTWTNERDNPVMTKIDRVLVSVDWELNRPDVLLQALSTNISDHAPLHLTT